MNVPSERTTITGCWAAAKSPTTGITLITNGRLRGVGDERLLAVEERDLGGLEDVGALVALGGVDEEVGLDVAEDGEAQRGAGRGVEAAELRHRQGIAALGEGNVQVGGEDWRTRRAVAVVLQPRHRRAAAGCCRRSCESARAGRRWLVTGPKPAAMRILRVLRDVEVEVHADPLEEVVAERDEADFDRHLQVLHAPQLLQQIDDLLVDFLRLADDQAQVGFEVGDRARPPTSSQVVGEWSG